MKFRKNISLVISVFLLLCLFTGCSSSNVQNSAVDSGYRSDAIYDTAPQASAAASPSVGSGMENESGYPGQKLIKTVNMRAETEDYDTLMTNINQKVSELGGYIESKEAYNGSAYNSNRTRNATMTIRIPVENLNEFVSRVSEFSNIISSNETTADVTLSYADTEGRLSALETEQERLLELMEKAETVTELLEIEKRLTDVRAELEAMASKLRLYDNLIEYSTVHLSITEVTRLTPAPESSVWDRIVNGFGESLENLGTGFIDFLVFALSNLPYLLPIVVVAAIVLTVLGIRKRSAQKKKAVLPSPTEEQK